MKSKILRLIRLLRIGMILSIPVALTNCQESKSIHQNDVLLVNPGLVDSLNKMVDIDTFQNEEITVTSFLIDSNFITVLPYPIYPPEIPPIYPPISISLIDWYTWGTLIYEVEEREPIDQEPLPIENKKSLHVDENIYTVSILRDTIHFCADVKKEQKIRLEVELVSSSVYFISHPLLVYKESLFLSKGRIDYPIPFPLNISASLKIRIKESDREFITFIEHSQRKEAMSL